MTTQTLPSGVILNNLNAQCDNRGVFIEIFRKTWDVGIDPVQWNIAKSYSNVLRGVHVHIKHYDYIVLAEGKALIGLHDLRVKSSTYGLGWIIEMDGKNPSRLTIPPGVVHGFYFCDDSIMLHAVSEYWDTNDEVRCHWQAPELNIPWEMKTVILSESDARAPSYQDMVDSLQPWQDVL